MCALKLRAAVCSLTVLALVYHPNAIAAVVLPQGRGQVSVGGAELSGRVVEHDRDVAVPGVRLVLWCDRCTQPLRETMTDATGSFRFPRIPADAYQIAASKPGWLPIRYGQTKPERAPTSIVVADGESRSDLIIHLFRGGAIDGRITGENSEPLAGVVVEGYRLRYSSTGRLLDSVVNSTTDDQGHYRLFSLAPGEYVVRAAPPILRLPTADGIQPQPLFGYVQTFMPGVSTVAGAARLTIGTGEVRSGVDLGLPFVAFRTIRGHLVSAAPLSKVTFSRLDDSGLLRTGESLNAEVQPNGDFLISNAPAGPLNLTVRAYPRRSAQDVAASISAGTLWGTARLTVGDENITDVSIAVLPGATVSGRIASIDGRPMGFPGGVSIALLPTGPTTLNPGEVLAGRINSDGSFSVGGVPPGVFHLTTAGLDSPWIIDAAASNGRDVLRGPLEVGSADISEVLVTLTDRPARMSGQLTVPTGATVTAFTVVAFPADPQVRADRPRAVFASRVRTDGRFSMPVIPGSYLLAVTEDIEEFAWFDPKVLDRLAVGAALVIVQPGEQKTQNLQIASR